MDAEPAWAQPAPSGAYVAKCQLAGLLRSFWRCTEERGPSMNTSLSQNTMVHALLPASRMRAQSSESSTSESTTSPSTGWRVDWSYLQLSIATQRPLNSFERQNSGQVIRVDMLGGLTFTEYFPYGRTPLCLPILAQAAPNVTETPLHLNTASCGRQARGGFVVASWTHRHNCLEQLRNITGSSIQRGRKTAFRCLRQCPGPQR
jgi:hypothetical protein